MKIVITDYPDVLGRNLSYEEAILREGLPGCEISVYPYTGNRSELAVILSNADAVLTAFLPMDKELLDGMPNLKCVCFNATGYNFIDYEEACRRNIAIIPIGEYCTNEVADHTMALMLALARGLRHYIRDIEENKNWQYYSGQRLRRIQGQVFGIFGLGKIGRAVARRAQAFGMEVLAYDPYLPADIAKEYRVRLTTEDELLERSHVISNHMLLTEETYHFFNRERFSKMKQQPIFLNVGRGGAVDEEVLVQALDNRQLFGAGLDVLEAEKPNLAHCKLLKRDNVILTPHAAFYTQESLADLQRISCENTVFYLKGEYHKVNRIVNQMLNGKVAGVVVEGIVGEQYVIAYDNIQFSDADLDSAKTSAVAVDKGNEDLLEIVNKVIAEQQEQGNFDKWVEEYSTIAAKNAAN